MSRFVAQVLLPIACLSVAAVAHAQIDAPVWYVQYEVRVHTNTTIPASGMHGPTTQVWKVDNVFENTVKLDMRNMGQVLSMDMSRLDPAKMKNMSPAEQLKFSQQMLDAMQNCANWMQGPVENVDDTDALRAHMVAVSVPVSINYDLTVTGNDLVSEMGTHYDVIEHTTAVYSGGKLYCSPDQVKFEMNSASKKYWLSIPFTFKDMAASGIEVDFVTASKSREKGTTAWKDDETTTNKMSIDLIGDGFRPDPLPNGAQVPLIEGTLDASGRISGEKSFMGHTDRTGPNVPVTLTYKYTVTQTPPPARPVAKK